MQATRYQTGHDPDQIARDAIGKTPRKVTHAEQAAQAAALTDAVLAGAA